MKSVLTAIALVAAVFGAAWAIHHFAPAQAGANHAVLDVGKE